MDLPLEQLLSVHFLLLTFSCSVEPVNFNSTCSLLWLFVPCILLLFLLLAVSSSCLRATLAAAPAPLEGPCEPASPVTSHQCRAGMRRGPGPGRGHHSGGWRTRREGVGGGWRLSRCSVREWDVDVTSPPSIVVGGDMDTEGHRAPVGVPL